MGGAEKTKWSPGSAQGLSGGSEFAPGTREGGAEPGEVCLSLSRVQLLHTHGLQPARLLCPWDSPGKNIGVGCHFLLQGIFPTQESNPGLLHCT